MNTVEFHRSSFAASASSFEATNCAPAAGRKDGCSDAVLVGKSQLTVGNVPLAQSSSKAMVGSLAGAPLNSVLTPKALWYRLDDGGAAMKWRENSSPLVPEFSARRVH